MKSHIANAGKAIVISVIIAVFFLTWRITQKPEQEVKKELKNKLTWEKCVSNPQSTVSENYPGMCVLADGQSAVRP